MPLSAAKLHVGLQLSTRGLTPAANFVDVVQGNKVFVSFVCTPRNMLEVFELAEIFFDEVTPSMDDFIDLGSSVSLAPSSSAHAAKNGFSEPACRAHIA